MKLITVLICLFFLGNSLAQRKRTGEPFKYPISADEIKINNLLNWSVDNYNAQARLKEIKYHIINGNLDLAKLMLTETTLSINFTKQIQNRYLAMTYFIEGNYELALKILDEPEMKDFGIQAKVCMLKVLSLIILEKPNRAKNEWVYCKQATRPYSKNDLTWMQTIVDLKTTKDKKYIENFFEGIEIDTLPTRFLRIYLKLALYLNQQDKIIPRFKFFGREPLENDIERELIGLNYYRNGNLVKAYQILESLDTANAEVFKGNLYLHQKKYEPAYAQFKLALKRKSNSQNALERLLPLSWKLNQYQEGISFLNRLGVTNRSSIEHDTLLAVFNSMAKNYKATDYYLRKINKKTNLTDPIEVSQIKVLNHLKLGNYYEVLDPALQGCSGNDGINCWLIIALNSWEGLLELLGKPLVIHEELVPLTEKYKNMTSPNKFEDEMLLDQKVIEELDNELIKL